MGSKTETSNEVTPITGIQEKILKDNEKNYNELFLPEIIKGINNGNENLKYSLNLNAINANDMAKQNTQAQEYNLAQRGLLGINQGVANLAQQQTKQQNTQFLAQHYMNTLDQHQSIKDAYLNILNSMSPNPTQSDGIQQTSNQKPNIDNMIQNAVGSISSGYDMYDKINTNMAKNINNKLNYPPKMDYTQPQNWIPTSANNYTKMSLANSTLQTNNQNTLKKFQ